MEDGEVNHECAIAGCYLDLNESNKTIVPNLVYSMLFLQKNRGRLSAGYCGYNPNSLDYGSNLIGPYIVRGDAKILFDAHDPTTLEKRIKKFQARAALGHLRYATVDVTDDDDAIIKSGQPFPRWHARPEKEFVFVFNGTISNHHKLRERLTKGYRFKTATDTEDIVNLYAQKIKEDLESKVEGSSVDFFNVTKKVMEELEGSYSMALLSSNGEMIIARDPRGKHPLFYTENPFTFASEDDALLNSGFQEDRIKEVLPGECLIYNGTILKKRQLISKDPSYCHFEWVYFLNVTSSFNGVSAYDVRVNLGNHLAEIEPLIDLIRKNPSEYVVIPIPSTAKPAAEAYANYLGLRNQEGIIKIDDARTFINSPGVNNMMVKRAYRMVKKIIKGKKVIIIDDSTVKGKTMQKLIDQVHSYHPLEIHLRFTEPTITNPCFNGIDMSTHEVLIANHFNTESLEEDAARYFKVNTVVFPAISGLVKAIGLPENELCLECLNGKYKEKSARELAQISLDNWRQKQKK